MPLENLAPSRHLLHGQAEPSADLKSGQGPVELDRSRVHHGGGGSPGIKALLVNTPCRFGREDVGRADWCIHHLLSGGGYGQLCLGLALITG